MAIDQNQDIHDFVPQDTPVQDLAENAEAVVSEAETKAEQQFDEYTQAVEQQVEDYTEPVEEKFEDYVLPAEEPVEEKVNEFQEQDTLPYEPTTAEISAEEETVEKYDTISDLSSSVPVDSFVDPNAGLDEEAFPLPGVSKAFTIFKKNGSSVSVLIGAIILGITTLFSLINPILIWTHIWPQVEQLLARSGAALPATFIGIDIQAVIYWLFLVMTVLLQLPMVLYAVGLIMYAIRARRHEIPSDEDVGLTPLKAGMIIYLIFWILSCLGCGYAIYTSVIALMAGVKLSAEVWTVLILQFVWLVVEILGLIYFIKSIRMVNSAIRVYATGEMPKHNLPLFVIIINYILIILGIVVAFPTVLAGNYSVPILVNFAMLVLRVAAGLLLNIPLHIARSELKRARESE